MAKLTLIFIFLLFYQFPTFASEVVDDKMSYQNRQSAQAMTFVFKQHKELLPSSILMCKDWFDAACKHYPVPAISYCFDVIYNSGQLHVGLESKTSYVRYQDNFAYTNEILQKKFKLGFLKLVFNYGHNIDHNHIILPTARVLRTTVFGQDYTLIPLYQEDLKFICYKTLEKKIKFDYFKVFKLNHQCLEYSNLLFNTFYTCYHNLLRAYNGQQCFALHRMFLLPSINDFFEDCQIIQHSVNASFTPLERSLLHLYRLIPIHKNITQDFYNRFQNTDYLLLIQAVEVNFCNIDRQIENHFIVVRACLDELIPKCYALAFKLSLFRQLG